MSSMMCKRSIQNYCKFRDLLVELEILLNFSLKNNELRLRGMVPAPFAQNLSHFQINESVVPLKLVSEDKTKN